MNSANDKVRRELEWVRTELATRLERIRRDLARAAKPLSTDDDDRAIEQENDEVLERLAASTEEQLAQYDRALARLDGGLYGICEICGFAIEKTRLVSMPQATRCSSCAGVNNAASPSSHASKEQSP